VILILAHSCVGVLLLQLLQYVCVTCRCCSFSCSTSSCCCMLSIPLLCSSAWIFDRSRNCCSLTTDVSFTSFDMFNSRLSAFFSSCSSSKAVFFAVSSAQHLQLCIHTPGDLFARRPPEPRLPESPVLFMDGIAGCALSGRLSRELRTSLSFDARLLRIHSGCACELTIGRKIGLLCFRPSLGVSTIKAVANNRCVKRWGSARTKTHNGQFCSLAVYCPAQGE
jgi:hypothetical protein